MSVVERKTQGEITYHNGEVEEVSDFYREGSGLVSPIAKVKLRKAKEYVNTDLMEKLKKEWQEKNKYAKGSTVKGEYNGIDLYDNVYIPSLNKSGMVTNVFTENGKRMVGIELLNGKGIKIEATKVEKKLAKGSTDEEDSYANGGMMDYGSDLTDESTVRGNITNGEIHCDTLTEIIGCEPNYPCHNVGSLKLTKCFLRPYYKIG